MKEKIALITDSASDLQKETRERYDIHMFPFRIIYKDREYLDGVDITPQEVYDRLPIEMPTTALPPLGEMHALYRKLENEGYTHVIIVSLSSGLSGIHNAFQLVSESYPNIQSFVFDSRSISLGEGLLVEECGRMIQAGKSFDEITAFLPEMRKRLDAYFVVGTLEYLKKGGRIGRVLGTISEILKIKPIISVGKDDGKYFTFDKVRGRKQSLQRLLEIGEEILAKDKCNVYIMSGSAREEALKVKEAFAKMENVLSVFEGGDISPVSGVHSGPGLVGVLFLRENRESAPAQTAAR